MFGTSVTAFVYLLVQWHFAFERSDFRADVGMLRLVCGHSEALAGMRVVATTCAVEAPTASGFARAPAAARTAHALEFYVKSVGCRGCGCGGAGEVRAECGGRACIYRYPIEAISCPGAAGLRQYRGSGDSRGGGGCGADAARRQQGKRTSGRGTGCAGVQRQPPQSTSHHGGYNFTPAQAVPPCPARH